MLFRLSNMFALPQENLLLRQAQVLSNPTSDWGCDHRTSSRIFNVVRLIMSDLRAVRWSGPGTVINEPENACLQDQALQVKDLQPSSPGHPGNLFNDSQSLNKRSV